MNARNFILILLLLLFSITHAQMRKYAIHKRGMLHQTVYNTGELGRAYDDGATGSVPNVPSFEWPAYSAVVVDKTPHNGQYNSFGAGFYISTHKLGDTARYTDQCGAVSDIDGNAAVVEGEFSQPLEIQRIENYPVLANGMLNPRYNPYEAEEIIITKWKALKTGIVVTRTSRAWSFPDYDDFIIYEYKLENTNSVELKDMIVAWGYILGASMFGYERKFNRWTEEDFRQKDQFARYDLKRYMTYNHDRDGKPDPRYFSEWASIGKYGGGLNSPQAVEILPLYYDYSHLSHRDSTRAFFERSQARYLFDSNFKMKQPYINRYENGNLYPSKIGNGGFLDCVAMRKTGPFSNTGTDLSAFGSYWAGRAKPSWTIGSRQPSGHIYGFGPYKLQAGDSMKFVIAEVAGFGPGIASDTVYKDLGGGCGSDGTDPEPGTHPVPSWYNEISYPEAKTPTGSTSTMGSDYMQTNTLPSYVNSNVISIRDVADRAIQIYSGLPLVKYDDSQFEPRTTPEQGVYRVRIPVPAPVITVKNTPTAKNLISWNSQVELFKVDSLNAKLLYYEVLRADHPLSRWTRVDSVGIHDSRYFNANDSTYQVLDMQSLLLESYYYAVVSVDSLGGRSGLTNITLHETQLPAAPSLERVYVVPNPLIVTSGYSGASPGGDINDRLGFFGLPLRATIRIFSYSGQLINTIEHQADSYSIAWYQVTRNNQRIASGVYFFTVDDPHGKRVSGKFVVIH